MTEEAVFHNQLQFLIDLDSKKGIFNYINNGISILLIRVHLSSLGKNSRNSDSSVK
jgi:hypothetical protein